MSDTYIVEGKRTPIGSFMGTLSSLSASELGSSTINGLFKEVGENQKENVDAVYMGNVLTAGVGQAPARQAALGAGIPESTPCITLNKVCGSGLQAVISASQELQLGDKSLVVAGGQESMSRTPFLLKGGREGMRMGHGKLIDSMVADGLWDPYGNVHMGNCAELCAKEYKFTREEQDEYAINSFKRAQKNMESGNFKSEISPVQVKGRKGDVTEISEDEGPFKAKFDKIPTLRPVFDKEGTVTAANASTINDGAAAFLMTNEEGLKKYNLQAKAKIVGYAGFAQKPEWFTTSPVGAVRNLMDKINWKIDEVDRWEVNEAFAVVAMAAQRDLEIPMDRFNVRGGAIALGHPIGASGARILVTLIEELRANNLKKGVAAICIGGGEALALAVEIC
jgi:acetyl-CoA C-acetyltransferase